MPSRPDTLRRFLRSPSVIVGEILGIAVAGVVGAFPPFGRPIPPLSTGWTDMGAAGSMEGISPDRVFGSVWFWALVLLAGASLAVAVTDQLRRLRVLWPRRLGPHHFRRAPFSVEFDRPTEGKRGSDSCVEVHTTGRIGLTGAPLFHLGLLLVIVAGMLRALFGVEAVVDLMEGETHPPTAEAWAAQWPGVLGKPLRLDSPVTLNEVSVQYYVSGGIRDVRARLTVGRAGASRTKELAVNRDLRAPGGRIFLGADFGPAALVEWRHETRPPIREAAFLVPREGQRGYEGTSGGPDGMRAHLRARFGQPPGRPDRVELQVVRENGLLFTGALRVGETIRLPGNWRLQLHGMPLWARLRGSRDPGLWLVYAGFALVLLGASIMFGVIRVDTCVSVTPAGDREHVSVALRAQRFAPLFRERFEQLVREQGGAT